MFRFVILTDAFLFNIEQIMLLRKKMNADERMNGASPMKIHRAASLFAQQNLFNFKNKDIVK